MNPKVYIDGQYYEKDQAKVSVFDHGFLYGDGVFEGIRVYNGKIFKCQEHLDRLSNSAAYIDLRMPMTKAEFEKAMKDTLELNNLRDAYIRLIVTRGIGNLGVDPTTCVGPSVIIITDAIALYPEELYRNGLEIISVTTVRTQASALDPRVKSLNYLNNILAKLESIRMGCLEALMLNSHGYVAECTGDNIFIVHNGIVKTPPPNAGILEGITRGVVMEICKKLGYPVEQPNMTRYDLFVADECFLTGTAAEIIPVVKIDSRVIGSGSPGPITKKLLAEFRKLTKES